MTRGAGAQKTTPARRITLGYGETRHVRIANFALAENALGSSCSGISHGFAMSFCRYAWSVSLCVRISSGQIVPLDLRFLKYRIEHLAERQLSP